VAEPDTVIGIVIVSAGEKESWMVTEVVPVAEPVTVRVFPEIMADAIDDAGTVTLYGAVPPDMVTSAVPPELTETFCGVADITDSLPTVI
jgi:hypothetical protein